MTEQETDSLKARIARLEEARGAAEKKIAKKREQMQSISGAGLALRLATELVASVGVGLFLGYLIDGWAKTSPLFLLIFFCFGLAAGVMGGIRAYRNFNAELAAQSDSTAAGDENGTNSP